MNIKKFKQNLLDELYTPYQQCTMCPLGFAGRTHVVFGEGNPDADLMLVGEGPGAQEDKQGKPFVGRSGMLLTKTLNTVHVQRSQIFITNIVKCRPPDNRTPTPAESETCKNLLLLKQIKIIRPKVICTLGSAATQGLLGKPISITKIHGTQIPWNDIILMPTYHPAYILRNNTMLPNLTTDLKHAAQKAGLQ